MSSSRLARSISGLSTDAKPLAVPDGTLYIEIDTGAIWILSNHVWILSAGSIFTKGAVIESPVAGTIVVWRAPFDCTVTHVRAFQDIGTGSVVTALDNSADILSTDITIAQAATWQDGGSLAEGAISAGDSLAIKITSVAGSPNYIALQIEFNSW